MISKNKASKYLLYAIGEIILVVIGILIALQINNWNENQKMIAQEQQILLELNEELAINVNAYEHIIKGNETIITETNVFLNQSRQLVVPPDSITRIANFFNYNPYLIEQPILNTILNSSDEKIIKHKNLLQNLRELKSQYNRVTQSLYYLDTFWNTHSAKYLITTGIGSSMGRTYSSDETLDIDKEFYSLLRMQNTLVRGYNSGMKRTKNKSVEIMDQIAKLSLRD